MLRPQVGQADAHLAGTPVQTAELRRLSQHEVVRAGSGWSSTPLDEAASEQSLGGASDSHVPRAEPTLRKAGSGGRAQLRQNGGHTGFVEIGQVEKGPAIGQMVVRDELWDACDIQPQRTDPASSVRSLAAA